MSTEIWRLGAGGSTNRTRDATNTPMDKRKDLKGVSGRRCRNSWKISGAMLQEYQKYQEY